VRPIITAALAPLQDVKIIVYEPTREYQNVAKRTGVEKLTPARALVAELIRRYWILGIECTLLEVQKLAYFLERMIALHAAKNPLDLSFRANRFGPYAPKLTHLLDGLDGSYLHCDKRLADASPFDIIRFEDAKQDIVGLYLRTEAKEYQAALNATSALIDGFESPLGMELLATVDWLLVHENAEPRIDHIKAELRKWPGAKAGERKLRLFNDRLLQLALLRLQETPRPNSS